MRLEDINHPHYILTIEGFNKRLDEVLYQFPTYAQAYEAVENEVESRYFHRKYKNFDSFRQSRARWVKQQQGKRKAANLMQRAA